MALPYNQISVEPVPGTFLVPDLTDTLDDESLELGGVALGDPSQGRRLRVWRAWITDDATAIMVGPRDDPSPLPVVLYTGADITAVSLAFDSNMQPAVSFTEAGVVKLRWFDTVSSAYVVTPYPGASSSRVCTDDKREAQEGASDVVLAYIRADGMLVWRQQRDRYTVERVVGPSRGFPLYRVGMSDANRLQFEMRDRL